MRQARRTRTALRERRLGFLAIAGLAVALPAAAVIWTRSSNVVKVPRGARVPLPNATYVTREWNAAVTGVEVQEGAGAGDTVSPKWLFYYKNTDGEQHFVAITVQCQDAMRKDRSRFTYTATLAPNTKDEGVIEIVAKLRAEEWRTTMYAKVTIDFLSSPSG